MGSQAAGCGATGRRDRRANTVTTLAATAAPTAIRTICHPSIPPPRITATGGRADAEPSGGSTRRTAKADGAAAITPSTVNNRPPRTVTDRRRRMIFLYILESLLNVVLMTERQCAPPGPARL